MDSRWRWMVKKLCLSDVYTVLFLGGWTIDFVSV